MQIGVVFDYHMTVLLYIFRQNFNHTKTKGFSLTSATLEGERHYMQC
jgi:hypothetical protein